MSDEKRKLLAASPLFFTFFSVLTGLLVGALVLLISGYSPLKAYHVIIDGIFSRPSYIVYTVIYSTPLIMTGNFTVYSYIEPFLAQVTGMLPDRITWVLVAYGAVGILGLAYCVLFVLALRP